MLEMQIDSYKISVIIPFYNSAQTIGRALESVISQTYPVTEIIIVDDGSFPKESTKLRNIIAPLENIRLIFLDQNRGPATARNLGWEAAKGDWVAFLDSDDAWHPCKLEAQIRAISSAGEPIAMIGSRTNVIPDDRVSCIPYDQKNIEISRISKRSMLLKNRFSTPTVMIKAAIPLRFSAGRKYSEDYELWMRVVHMGLPVLKVEYPLAFLFKAPYGESGLSANLVLMSFGEIETFWNLFRSGVLTAPEFSFGITVSFAKSIRRLAISFFKEKWKW